MTRRTFGQRAALFVLGCALQVSGAATLLKRRVVTRLHQIEIGMGFHPNVKDHAETWIVVDEGNYIIRNGVREDVGNSRENKWNAMRICDGSIPQQDPALMCFDQESNVALWNFHWPGI